MGPAQAIRTGLAKSFQFSGRASRSEFWWFACAWVSVAMALLFVVVVTRRPLTSELAGIYLWRTLQSMFLASPLLLASVAARRHHDIGLPAFLPLVMTAPVLGLVYMRLAVFPLTLGFMPPFLELFWSVADLMVLAFITLLVVTGLVALLPSQAVTNLYGPPPLKPTP
jgi:uncharacterized membrane protein YhaH (DUF805 family)